MKRRENNDFAWRSFSILCSTTARHKIFPSYNQPSACRFSLVAPRLSLLCERWQEGKSLGKLFLFGGVLWHLKHSVPRRHSQRKRRKKRMKSAQVFVLLLVFPICCICCFFFLHLSLARCLWVDIRSWGWDRRDNLPILSGISNLLGWSETEEKAESSSK